MRRIVGISLSIALGLTAMVALPVAADPTGECKANGGANWEWEDGSGNINTNYLQVNAKIDKKGEPKGVIHWRQVRPEDPANDKNLVADVTYLECICGEPHAAYLRAETRGDFPMTVYAAVRDKGEPGLNDVATVRTTDFYPVDDDDFNENPKKGNYQVWCDELEGLARRTHPEPKGPVPLGAGPFDVSRARPPIPPPRVAPPAAPPCPSSSVIASCRATRSPFGVRRMIC